MIGGILRGYQRKKNNIFVVFFQQKIDVNWVAYKISKRQHFKKLHCCSLFFADIAFLAKMGLSMPAIRLFSGYYIFVTCEKQREVFNIMEWMDCRGK